MQRDEDSLQSVKDLFDPGVTYISRHRFYLRCLRDYPEIVLPFLQVGNNILFVRKLPARLRKDVIYVDISNPEAICIHSSYNDADFIKYPTRDVKTKKYVTTVEYLSPVQSSYLLQIKETINQKNKLQSISNLKKGKVCVAAIEADIDKRNVPDKNKRAMKQVMMMCAMAYHFNKVSQPELNYHVQFNCKIDRDWPDAFSLYLDTHPGKTATDLIYAFIETVFKDDGQKDNKLFYFNSRFLRFTSWHQAESAIDKLKENKDNKDLLFAIPRSMLSQPASICVTHSPSEGNTEIVHEVFDHPADMCVFLDENVSFHCYIVPTVLITPHELQQLSEGKTITRSGQNLGGYIRVNNYSHIMPPTFRDESKALGYMTVMTEKEEMKEKSGQNVNKAYPPAIPASASEEENKKENAEVKNEHSLVIPASAREEKSKEQNAEVKNEHPLVIPASVREEKSKKENAEVKKKYPSAIPASARKVESEKKSYADDEEENEKSIRSGWTIRSFKIGAGTLIGGIVGALIGSGIAALTLFFTFGFAAPLVPGIIIGCGLGGSIVGIVAGDLLSDLFTPPAPPRMIDRTQKPPTLKKNEIKPDKLIESQLSRAYTQPDNRSLLVRHGQFAEPNVGEKPAPGSKPNNTGVNRSPDRLGKKY